MTAVETFTAAEREFMVGALHSINLKKAAVDYDKLALLAGINTRKTANNKWVKIRPKIVAAAEKSQIAELNEGESMLAALVWLCFKEDIGLPNYQRMADLGVTNTKKTANNNWGKLKHKFDPFTAGADGVSTPTSSPAPGKTPKSKKSTGAKRKADGDNVDETPTKRTKRASPPSWLLPRSRLLSSRRIEPLSGSHCQQLPGRAT
ncbi:hypothetical protein PG993_008415 [Apiospora rasikravindrae]|uniref:Uncharacterized protein n=1 Tax=Apiospora rasikravindrae TaxID=990691 RepID=A0ABR1T0A6_9PEZI